MRSWVQPRGRCQDTVDQGFQCLGVAGLLVAVVGQSPLLQGHCGIDLYDDTAPAAVDRLPLASQLREQAGAAHRGMADPVSGDAERYQARFGAHGLICHPPGQPPAPLLAGQAGRDRHVAGTVLGDKIDEGARPPTSTWLA
jgi:hypothetical protein